MSTSSTTHPHPVAPASPAEATPETAVRVAAEPPETRGRSRSDVRLLVSSSRGHRHHRFADLPSLLVPGDVLVVNRSATLPASLEARGAPGRFLLNLSTKYGPALWLAEARWSTDRPGPVPLAPGERIEACGVFARVAGRHPSFPRLTFVRFATPIEPAMHRLGVPIRYGYVPAAYPLEAYQTVFADRPGSAEMPSAGRPFTPEILDELARRDVHVARVTLHAGVSSLDRADGSPVDSELYAEPFEVPPETAAAVNAARREGRRVVAVGTTVVRALESAHDGRAIVPTAAFTKRMVTAQTYRGSVDGMITGLHDAGATHLAMLRAIAGSRLVEEAYREAGAARYRWHEFGDSHLLWAA